MGRAAAVETVAPATDAQCTADAGGRFAIDLYGKLAKGDENLFYSPYSISTALAMTYAGARTTTAEEMAKTLRFDLPPGRLHPAYAEMIRDLNEAGKKGDFQLSVANRLWGQKGEGFLKEFLDLTERNYGAGLSEVDFVGDAEGARKTINTWVEKQTAEKIKELLRKGVFDRKMVLVLTNAVYMKADWLTKFQKQRTRDEPFYAAGKKWVQVSTMHGKGMYNYAEADDLQLLELVYRGNRLSMVVLLPRPKDGLADLERKLTFGKVNKWLSFIRMREVGVALPRFQATMECSLKEVLQSLGMAKAFIPGDADFSGMNGRKSLYISAVVHKAFVDVDEAGTEAATTTAAEMALAEIPEFRADHPFVFLIRDRVSGAILFMGRVTEPKTE